MLTQQHINEIADYLRKFKTGELEHKQKWYHCNTAHCLAGWKALHDAQKAGFFPKDETHAEISDERINRFLRDFGTFYEDTYARDQWGLDDKEAAGLFNANRTLDQMIANLQQIAASHGLTCPSI